MDYKWKALSVTSIGVAMSAVDSTIVILALFPIATSLKSNFVTIVWVIIAYILMSTALVLSLGRIADIYGRKKMYNLGFVVFTIGSGLSGAALTGTELVFFRAVQGIGAAMLIANSFAIVSEAFPPSERGRAFGLNAIVWGSGSVLGIVLGGVIIAFTTWRLIFFINVPIGIFGTLWAYKTLRESKETGSRKVETFDIQAAILFTLGLMALLFGTTWGLLHGWTDPVAITALMSSPLFFALFGIWEAKYSNDPIIDFGMFRNRVFTFSIISAILQSIAVFSANFLLLFYFEGIDGLPILTAAYLIIPMAVMVSIVGPFAGMLSDRIGSRIVASSGLAVQAIVLIILSQLSLTTPLVLVASVEGLYGIGGGLFWPANTSAIMSATAGNKYGVASGIMNTFRSTGMVLSFALSLVAATSVIPAAYVYHLFVGDIVGRLPVRLAGEYLAGQSFAFELSAVLLGIATFISVLRNPMPGGISRSFTVTDED
ncbi:MAG: MFS transporter [Thermoplasmata archaeon]|nr:MFS transporter [Candidatus Sysuiplasma acidicola]